MLCTTAAEFAASGTCLGSLVFHGPVREKPLVGRCWPPACAAGAHIVAATTAATATADPNRCTRLRMALSVGAGPAPDFRVRPQLSPSSTLARRPANPGPRGHSPPRALVCWWE